jgi:hypothetical protein
LDTELSINATGTPNNALHLTAIPLCSIVAGELGRYILKEESEYVR